MEKSAKMSQGYQFTGLNDLSEKSEDALSRLAQFSRRFMSSEERDAEAPVFASSARGGGGAAAPALSSSARGGGGAAAPVPAPQMRDGGGAAAPARRPQYYDSSDSDEDDFIRYIQRGS